MGIFVNLFRGAINTCVGLAEELGLAGNILGDALSDILQNGVNSFGEYRAKNKIVAEFAKGIDDEYLELLGDIADECTGKLRKDKKKAVSAFCKSLIKLNSDSPHKYTEQLDKFLEKSNKYRQSPDDLKKIIRNTFGRLGKLWYNEQYNSLNGESKALYHCLINYFEQNEIVVDGEEYKQKLSSIRQNYRFAFVKNICPTCGANGHVVKSNGVDTMYCKSCGESFTLKQYWDEVLSREDINQIVSKLKNDIIEKVEETKAEVKKQAEVTRAEVKRQGEVTGTEIKNLNTRLDGAIEGIEAIKLFASNNRNTTPTGTIEMSNGRRYIGERVDGIAHGKGKLYSANGSKIYEGNYENNKPNGQGVKFNADGSKLYEGEYKDGKRNGYGVYFWQDGSRYEGEFKDGKRHGHGVYFCQDGRRCEGEFKDDKPNGRGVEFNADGSKLYEGEYKDGKRNGHGVYFGQDGSRYEGKFKDDKPNGRGVLFCADGSKLYEGEFKDGNCNGRGVNFDDDGSKLYEGEFKDGEPHGHGIEYDILGRKDFEGDYRDGERHGHGTEYLSGEKVFEGEYQEGLRHGHGILYTRNGNIESEGIWCNGVYIGK